MDIIISNSSGRPIYDQISEQIKEKILTGQLEEGEALPSMRLLAKELRISVITTIVTMTGKGSFVAEKNTEAVREEYLKRIEEHIGEIVRLSVSCHLGLEDIKEMVTLAYEEERDE